MFPVKMRIGDALEFLPDEPGARAERLAGLLEDRVGRECADCLRAALGADAEALEEELRDLRRELDAARDRIAELEDRLEECRARRPLF